MASTGKKLAGGAVGVAVAAAALVASWEGYYGKTYNDIVGVPTVCYGETEKSAVAEGRKRTFTKAECLEMLQQSLKKYDDGFMRCVKRPIPDSVHIAGISFTYNVGIGGACKSSFVRKINAGDFKGACDALLLWNKAGGRVVKGLDNRRRDERRVCLEGLPT